MFRFCRYRVVVILHEAKTTYKQCRMVLGSITQGSSSKPQREIIAKRPDRDHHPGTCSAMFVAHFLFSPEKRSPGLSLQGFFGCEV